MFKIWEILEAKNDISYLITSSVEPMICLLSKNQNEKIIGKIVMSGKCCDIFVQFQMVFDKMVAICQDLKWLCFRISNPIWNSDHLQTNLLLTIQNLD